MAVFDHTTPRGVAPLSHLINGAGARPGAANAVSLVAETLTRSVFSVVDTVAAWNMQRRTRAALEKLSAHELDDIGLTPADIARLTGR